jgi:hypothetical protein
MDFVPLTPFFYTLSLFLQMAKVELSALYASAVDSISHWTVHPPSLMNLGGASLLRNHSLLMVIYPLV